ncbi:MAG: flagellin [Pseudomonadota bacterium]
MSSILTNNSAMVALQTLKGINMGLEKTQAMISTGKAVGSAKDNAAVWSISKVMESDVSGFKAISDSLALGESTVAVARNASETVTNLLTEIKSKIVSAQEENVDRTKIQTDIDALTNQIQSVVSAAQFNGLNLIDGSDTTDVQILSSLDRDAAGNVTASQIDVTRQNLSTTTPVTAQAMGDGNLADEAAANVYIDGSGTTIENVDTSTNASTIDGTNEATVANNATETITIGQVAEGISYQIDIGGIDVNVVGGGTATSERQFQYVASASDGVNDVAQNLADQINAFFGAATDASLAYSVSVANDNQIVITNGSATTTNANMLVNVAAQTGGTAGSSASSGGLGALQSINVTTDAGAASALTGIETLIQTSIDAAAAFGSVEGRIEIQSSFVDSITDSLQSGIGALVDADMEEASARLQALQVQQQLGIQSLSIANQQPQIILSLFR